MRKQKTVEEWESQYKSGEITVRDLWDAGFRPMSNKYRSAVLEYKYHKRCYRIRLTLTSDDYEAFKFCKIDVMEEQIEAEERAEYERFKYLQNKFA